MIPTGHRVVMKMNERITELETQLAFQDDTINELNRAVTDQQNQINNLKAQVELLHKKLQSLSESVVLHDENEAPPPHY